MVIIKKVYILIAMLILLVGCSSNSGPVEVNNDIVKKDEMTEMASVNYLGQITTHFRDLNKAKSNFEKRSALQATISRCESITKEIKEQYADDLQIAQDIIGLAEQVKGNAEIALGNDYINATIREAQKYINEFSDKHYGGDVPVHLRVIGGF